MSVYPPPNVNGDIHFIVGADSDRYGEIGEPTIQDEVFYFSPELFYGQINVRLLHDTVINLTITHCHGSPFYFNLRIFI